MTAMAMQTMRRRQVCGTCEGAGVVPTTATPGRWFTDMGLTYEQGTEFVSREMANGRADEVLYGDSVTDDGLDDGATLAAERNERLQADLCGEQACWVCKGYGTVPAPLTPDEQMYDRGELLAEAGAMGMQAYNDMQDEWSEYVSGTGSHADPLQRSIDAQWSRQHEANDYE